MAELPSDDDLLLDFAGDSDVSIEEARKLLVERGDAWRCQLIMARHLEHQAAHLEELRAGNQLGDADRLKYFEGYVEALRHIAENLRSGEYLPGGDAFDDTVEGRAF